LFFRAVPWLLRAAPRPANEKPFFVISYLSSFVSVQIAQAETVLVQWL
jgi:hypothetical protein